MLFIQFDQLVNSLNIKGVRECQLLKNLRTHHATISSALRRRQEVCLGLYCIVYAFVSVGFNGRRARARGFFFGGGGEHQATRCMQCINVI